jgi:hypothetical protein
MRMPRSAVEISITAGQPIQVRWVLIPLFATLTGYSEKAVRRKIEEGIWLQGKHYQKAPDGRITMNMQAYYAWVENGRMS